MNPNFCRPGDPDCVPAAPAIVPATLLEREAAIFRGIASGNNACGSLMRRDEHGNAVLNEAFIRQAIRPTLTVYEQEAEQLRRDLAAVRAENATLRRESEYLAANPGHTLEQARRALAAGASRN